MSQIKKEPNYVYSFIRTDIPFEQQIIQSAHSALEAGRHLRKPDSISHLVLLQVQDEPELVSISEMLRSFDIKHHLFFEPDNNMGYSSLTTEPIEHKALRKIFSKFPLYIHFNKEIQNV